MTVWFYFREIRANFSVLLTLIYFYMEKFRNQYCAVCHNARNNENCEKIGNITKNMLEVILLKLDFNDFDEVICEVCSVKVMEAFKFKSMCLGTDNTIISYVDAETGRSADLGEIYAKERGIDPLIGLLDSDKICRLCMQLIRTESVSVHDVNVDLIKSYIPEINFSVFEGSVICKGCLDSFDAHSSFVRKYLEVEEKFKPSLIPCIKTEEIEIKYEINRQEELNKIESIANASIKSELIEIATEENYKSNVSNHEGISEMEKTKCKSTSKCKKNVTTTSKVMRTVYRCEKCDYKTVLKKRLTNHELKHEDPSKIKMHNCDICTYKSKQKYALFLHQLQHKSTSEVDMFKCIYCEYEAKIKKNLRAHFIVHHGENLLDPEENSKIRQMFNFKNLLAKKMYKCDRCLYRTLNETNFLSHQSESHEKLPFKCEDCSYTTMSNSCFTTHQLIHKDPSEAKIYKCHNCNYKTNYKMHIVRHQLVHQNREQVRMHKCIYCSYESKYKEAVKSHIQIHHRDIVLDSKENLKVRRMLNLRKPFLLNVYKCDKCIFETIYRHTFRDHQLTHKNPSEVQMYKCDTCDWETKYKRKFTKHKLMHKGPCEEQIYKCDTCGFATKARGSLKRHQLIHKNAPDVQIYKCHNCNYETKHKTGIISHQLQHKNPSQMLMYKCDICDFKTKYKNNIGKHKQLMHKNL